MECALEEDVGGGDVGTRGLGVCREGELGTSWAGKIGMCANLWVLCQLAKSFLVILMADSWELQCIARALRRAHVRIKTVWVIQSSVVTVSGVKYEWRNSTVSEMSNALVCWSITSKQR